MSYMSAQSGSTALIHSDAVSNVDQSSPSPLLGMMGKRRVKSAWIERTDRTKSRDKMGDLAER